MSITTVRDRTSHESAAKARTARFARRQQRGLILGFSGPRIAAIGVSLALFTLGVAGAGVAGALMLAPLWILALSSAAVRWKGRFLVEIAPTAAHFGTRVITRQDRYRAKLSKPRPSGTLALPGDAASLRFFVSEAGAVMVHDPYEQTLTSIARVGHPAFVLLGPDAQDQRVSAWGRLVASVGTSGSLCRVQVVESSLPDGGRGIADWWQSECVTNAPTWAAAQYETLLASATTATSVHRSLIAISMRMPRTQLGRAGQSQIAGAAAALQDEMRSFEAGLAAASLQLEGWLSDRELAAVVRSAYDPDSSVRLGYWDVGRDLSSCGPLGVEEHWDHIRHDSGFSTVLWLSEWPRIDVPTWFLHPIVFEQGVRRSLTLTAEPLSTEEAIRQIRRQKVEYVSDSAQKAKLGQLADLSDSQELEDVLDRERALISGHADVRYTGLIAVTAPDREGLRRAVSAVEQAALRAVCETRILYGQQAAAFTAAALPLGRGVH